VEHRRLGDTGTLVSWLCLGTMTFGDETPESDAHAILDRYVEAGGNVIDTADVYSYGASEAIIGRWLAQRGGRDDLVVATKARIPMGDGPNRAGAGRVHLQRSIDASLARLDIDHVDLYQVHAWDPLTPIEETLEALDDLVRAGKVRHVGVSNFTGWQLQRAALTARYRGLAPVVTLQPQYNLITREMEWELLPLCEEERIGLLPWSPLAGGWLTGKYRRDERPTGSTRLGEDPERGTEAYDKRNTEYTWSVLGVAQRIAAEREVPMAQVAINWLRTRPMVSSVILGVRTLEQLDGNLGADGWRLDQAEIAELDEVGAPPTPDYPYTMIAELEQGRRDQLG
jgi:aryl-alcohol dehydrogenase-like predicted oxidoreductase